MTKRRFFTLAGGVAFLALASWWRLRDGAPPPPPLSPRDLPHGAQAPPPESKPGPPSFAGRTMGTSYTVKFESPHPGATSIAQAAVQSALDDVVQSMSTYEPKSEISLINTAPAWQDLPTSPEFLRVFRVAKEVHAISDGAFDVTVGPLVELYGFGASKPVSQLDPEELKKRQAAVGMEHVQLSEDDKTLRKLVDGVQLDFGGIAKGFGVDQAAAALEKLKIKNYMIEVGGEIRVRGKKSTGDLWTLAIEEPTKDGRKVHGTLQLPKVGGALATSGDYRNFRSIDGTLVSHTFDPRTKKPVPHRTASVSVVRPTATEADALATAFIVLPPQESLRIADEKGYAVYILTHKNGGGFDAQQSKAFEKLEFSRR